MLSPRNLKAKPSLLGWTLWKRATFMKNPHNRIIGFKYRSYSEDSVFEIQVPREFFLILDEIPEEDLPRILSYPRRSLWEKVVEAAPELMAVYYNVNGDCGDISSQHLEPLGQRIFEYLSAVLAR
jgi:hypothetical protein